jgi:hypothetical protein
MSSSVSLLSLFIFALSKKRDCNISSILPVELIDNLVSGIQTLLEKILWLGEGDFKIFLFF